MPPCLWAQTTGHGSVGSVLSCSNNKIGFTANCICFLQDLCLICFRIWKINEAQKLLEENGLTLRQLKVSQKNLVPILNSARIPGDTMTFSKQSLVLSHWTALGAELQCWALTLLLKSVAATQAIGSLGSVF